MHLFLTIVAFVVIFSFLIFIHELGHFMAAKRAGVKVEEFGFGMPPRLFGVKRGETIYSINWIPFGGFVRLLGESDDSKEGRTSKRSLTNQPLRTQAWIVCAGVVMNLLLSFVLLTVGFAVGIEPLIATEEDFLDGIRAGTVHVEPGIVVVDSTTPLSTVDYNGEALEVRPFEPGDRVLGFETIEAWQYTVDSVRAGTSSPYVSMNRADGTGGAEILTPELLDQTTFAPLYIPRLVYRDAEDSVFHGQLQTGDVLLYASVYGVDAKPILTVDDLNATLLELSHKTSDLFYFMVYRPNVGKVTVTVDMPNVYPLLTYVESASPADQMGLQAGDEILSVNGVDVHSAEQVVALTQSSTDRVDYVVQKEGSLEPTALSIPLRKDGRVGVSLADPLPYYGRLSLVPSYTVNTLMSTDKVSYGWKAPVVAVEEMWRLGKMTAGMFVNVLKQFVTANGVPEGVSGPVGIAQMTGVTLEQGWAAMLRFVALLSLSLGVINILPFPALDGGHFAIILLKAVTGKKESGRWERVVNLGGFLFLLSFILYITFNDVLNLF